MKKYFPYRIFVRITSIGWWWLWWSLPNLHTFRVQPYQIFQGWCSCANGVCIVSCDGGTVTGIFSRYGNMCSLIKGLYCGYTIAGKLDRFGLLDCKLPGAGNCLLLTEDQVSNALRVLPGWISMTSSISASRSSEGKDAICNTKHFQVVLKTLMLPRSRFKWSSRHPLGGCKAAQAGFFGKHMW